MTRPPTRRLACALALSAALAAAGCAHAAPADDFFVAIKRDNASAVQTLLRRGFDPNTARDAQGQRGLILAIRESSNQVLKVLLASPATKVEVRNVQDESPLMIAAIKGDLPLVKVLIERDADVNKPGWAPLHYAVSNNLPQQLDIARLLLEHHAFIDAESPNGTTPLMMAARYGTEQAVKLLFEEGADPVPRNQQGLSAADFARMSNRTSLAAQLDEAAARRAPQTKGAAAPRRW